MDTDRGEAASLGQRTASGDLEGTASGFASDDTRTADDREDAAAGANPPGILGGGSGGSGASGPAGDRAGGGSPRGRLA
jgi:hypothetical protein